MLLGTNYSYPRRSQTAFYDCMEAIIVGDTTNDMPNSKPVVNDQCAWSECVPLCSVCVCVCVETRIIRICSPNALLSWHRNRVKMETTTTDIAKMDFCEFSKSDTLFVEPKIHALNPILLCQLKKKKRRIYIFTCANACVEFWEVLVLCYHHHRIEF